MAAHENAAIFDASPLGKIEVIGRDAEAFLLHTCAGFMSRPPGSVIYSSVLNERGTYESDLTAQRIAEDHYRLFVGTASIRRDLAWFHRHSSSFNVSLADSTGDYAILALMGPDAARVAAEVGAPELNDLKYFHMGLADICGQRVRAARISYVGEAGWELTCPSESASSVYAALAKAGARLAGLHAQTSMRLEKHYCSIGHELDGDVTPIDVGLDFATRRSGGFIGFKALEQHRAKGARSSVVSLTFEDRKAVPLGHEPIYSDGKIVGQTTTCAYGFRVNAPIALAHAKNLSDGQLVHVDIARQMFNAKVTGGSLYDPDGSRMKG